MKDNLNRIYGLMVVESQDSNINGDPDLENDPRTDSAGNGMLSGVSINRKLRDMVDDKEGPAWKQVAVPLSLNAKEYDILEKRGRQREEIRKLSTEEFRNRYWDARLFGSTFLESAEGASSFLNTGVVHFTVGRSVAPVEIYRMTLTNKAGVEADKDRGMAPMAFRVVRHAVYVIPFHINPVQAHKTGCTSTDIELMLKLLPYVYSANESMLRSSISIRHIWCAEHKSPLGSCQEHRILEAMMPVKLDNPTEPSQSILEYHIPKELPLDIKEKLLSFRDLMSEA